MFFFFLRTHNIAHTYALLVTYKDKKYYSYVHL